MRKIIIENLRCIKKLEFSLPQKQGIYLLVGANGRGKSTLKELFRKQNLKKNFSLENEEQINMIFDVFGNYDYLIYSIK